jgi:putative methanogenesis marker protein 8
MTEHIFEMAGARVRVKDGKIEVLTDPTIVRCPLREDLYGCVQESRETVDKVLREHIKELGMYGPNRVLELDQKPVSFGASEIITDAMAEGLIDAAVVVCEGAGTVIVRKPEVSQAIGAHMTGLIRTEPIPEIQKGLEERESILLDRQGTMNQVRGCEKALEAGFKKIVVTITGLRAFESEKLRDMGKTYGFEPVILAVHNTGISESQAEILAKHCDLVWACASKWVRRTVAKKAKMQIGVSIPVFALTDMGKRLVLNRALHFDESLVIHRAGLPYLRTGRQPDPLL